VAWRSPSRLDAVILGADLRTAPSSFKYSCAKEKFHGIRFLIRLGCFTEKVCTSSG
jgi:hypothetical protein